MDVLKKTIKKRAFYRKNKNDFLLIEYSKSLSGEQKQGKILMRGKIANGFIEKMIEAGFKTKVFEIQYTKNRIRYCMKIGNYYDEIENNNLNKEISESILPFIKLIKTKI